MFYDDINVCRASLYTIIYMHRATDKQKSTVDEKELNFFKNFLPTWWSNGKLLLHKMNSVRVPFIQTGLANAGKLTSTACGSAKPLLGINILDVGCGGGILSVPLAQAGAIVTGMDAALEVVECARVNANDNEDFRANNLKYVCDTIEHLCEYHVEQYDAVVASEIIEHVRSPELFLTSCVQTLKPGGSIFITTINKTMWSWLKAIIMYEYVTGTIPKGTHEWDKFISPADITDILNQHNCTVKLVSGWQYSMFTKTWTTTDNLSVFYLLHAVKNL